MWLWVRGLGLFVSFPSCGAGFNLLGGPPPLLPGALWPRMWPAVPVCGLLVRRLPGCAVACFGSSFTLGSVVPCCAALCRVASRRAVARCTVVRCGEVCRGLALCRAGSVEVSLACVVVRSAGPSVAGWWLGGAVRCGCLAGSVLWGPGRAARAGGSGGRPWGCPPRGPVPWSCVLWGSRSLALVAVAVPSSSSGAYEVALVAAGLSPGCEGVVVRRAAAFPVASSVGVARSPRVGVPSIPRVVSGGWWVCAGVIRTASDACFGGVLGGPPP